MNIQLRQSAAVVVLRDGQEGIEVLLMKRAQRGDQNSGAWVFPGGMLDVADADAASFCKGPTDAQANEGLELSCKGLSYYVAAIRECFEEAGILFSEIGGHSNNALKGWRAELLRGDTDMTKLCSQNGLILNAGQLLYISRWVTPEDLPKRFDTRFFVAKLPVGQQAIHDGNELVDSRWVPLPSGLKSESDVTVLGPARWIIQGLSIHKTVDGVLSWAREKRAIPRIQPSLEKQEDGSVRIVLPEVAKRGLLG